MLRFFEILSAVSFAVFFLVGFTGLYLKLKILDIVTVISLGIGSVSFIGMVIADLMEFL